MPAGGLAVAFYAPGLVAITLLTKAVAPVGSITGTIAVTTPGRTATSAGTFTRN